MYGSDFRKCRPSTTDPTPSTGSPSSCRDRNWVRYERGDANGLGLDLGLGLALVQGDSGPDQSLERLFIDLLAFVEVDGTPGVPVETGVEEAGRILQGCPFGKGQLDDALVGLARTDHSVGVPHRNTSPLPLLDD